MLLRILFASALSLPFELTYAALSSSVSCESPSATGPVHTLNEYATSTVTQTLSGNTVTGTIFGGVPDHTVTIHKRVFSTQQHEEYIDSYISTIWDRYTEIFPRPIITVTISPDSPAPTPSESSGSIWIKKNETGDESDWVEGKAEQSPSEPTEENDWAQNIQSQQSEPQTILCNTTYYTTSTDSARAISTTHISGGPPSRTFTVTVTHTEFVDNFLTPPGTVATVHEPTFYHSHTTSYAVVTATTTTDAAGETYVNVWGIDEGTEGWKG